jgi:hypothetical protein
MSFSGRLHNIALGGCVAALLFAPFALSAQENKAKQKNQAKQPQAEQKAPAPQPPPAPAIDGPKPVETDWNKVECAKPKNHDEADLCEQRRMSQAAENGVWLSKIQIGLGIIGAVLVLWSLFYTRVAAIAAKDAAVSSLQSALNASKQVDAAIKAESPYVTIRITEAGIQFCDGGAFNFRPKSWFAFEFVNHGKTPALLKEFYETYPVVTVLPPEPIDPMVTRGRLLPIGTVSANGSPFRQDTNLIQKRGVDIFSVDNSAWRTKYLLFQGYLRYADAFGNHYIMGWLARFFPEHDAWALRGDEKYNYSRKEQPEDVPPHPSEVP